MSINRRNEGGIFDLSARKPGLHSLWKLFSGQLSKEHRQLGLGNTEKDLMTMITVITRNSFQYRYIYMVTYAKSQVK